MRPPTCGRMDASSVFNAALLWRHGGDSLSLLGIGGIGCGELALEIEHFSLMSGQGVGEFEFSVSGVGVGCSAALLSLSQLLGHNSILVLDGYQGRTGGDASAGVGIICVASCSSPAWRPSAPAARSRPMRRPTAGRSEFWPILPHRTPPVNQARRFLVRTRKRRGGKCQMQRGGAPELRAKRWD